MKKQIISILLTLLSPLLLAKPEARSERQAPNYISGTFFDTHEQHLAFGFEIPLHKSKFGSHSLKLGTKESKFKEDNIKEIFKIDSFYSTTLSYNIKKQRDSNHIPWLVSLSQSIHGYNWFENRRNSLGLRVTTGHKTGRDKWSYGVILSDQGAFRAMPIPFFVYSTTVWRQFLRVGFPFLSLRGPNENIWNYQINLSPMGITIGGSKAVNEYSKLNLRYIFKIDNYLLDTKIFADDESLLIKKQLISFEYSHAFNHKINLQFEVGKEFEKVFFKGKNIFKKNGEEYSLESSLFIRLGGTLGF